PGGQLPVQRSGQLVERKREGILQIGEPVLPVQLLAPGFEEFPGKQQAQAKRGQPRGETVQLAACGGQGRGLHRCISWKGRQGEAGSGPITPARRNCCSRCAPGAANVPGSRWCRAASCCSCCWPVAAGDSPIRVSRCTARLVRVANRTAPSASRRTSRPVGSAGG